MSVEKLLLVLGDEAYDSIVQEGVCIGGVSEVQMIELGVRDAELSDEISQLSGEFFDVCDRCHPIVVGEVEVNWRGDGFQVVSWWENRSVFEEVLGDAVVEEAEFSRVNAVSVVDELIDGSTWGENSN